ncbi:MAG: crosslink repair DNA glycosylase YcaQ family protein [Anaerolineales bacterium]|jgi:uncharacterized protein YcaQ
MQRISFTKQQARRFMLRHQGLWPPQQLQGKSGILSYFHRVGCVQYDPLNIVGHNQELVLQSRVEDFRPVLLQELLYQDRRLIDALDKNMSIYRVEDWPYFRRRREAARGALGRSDKPVAPILEQVRKKIEQEGPISSSDLDYDQSVDWSWAPTRLSRAALESMYFWGELVIHHRIHTRKVYDFATRHIPENLLQAPDPNETQEEYLDWHVLRRIGGLGLLWNRSGDAWLGILDANNKARILTIRRLLEQEKLIEVQVEGIGQALYMRSQDRANLEEILEGDLSATRAVILAPLDNLLWDRRLIKELFDFDFIWEVYKPAAERRYGYYVLPVLYGDRFVARFEPRRDKENASLAIKNWWWEPGVTGSEEMHAELHNCLKKFAGFLETDGIQLDGQAREGEGLEWLAARGE